MINKLFVKLRQKGFYYKFLTIIFFMALIILCATMFVGYDTMGRGYNEEIKNTNLQILKQVQITVDTGIYEEAFGILSEHFLVDLPQNQFGKFLYNDTNYSVYEYYKCYLEISAIRNINNAVTNLFIYNRKQDVLIDALHGLAFNLSQKPAAAYNYLPYIFYDPVMEEGENIRIFSEAENLAEGLKGITVLCAISLPDAGRDDEEKNSGPLGYIAINMEVSQSLSSLYSLMPETGTLLVLDGAGRVLMKKAPENSVLDEAVLAEHLPAGGGISTFKHGGITYALMSIHSARSDWQYVSCVPLDTLMSKSIEAVRRMIIITLVIAAGVLVLARFAATAMYRPINKIVDKISKNNISRAGGELAAITEALAFFEDQAADIENTMTHNRDLLEYKLVMNILHDSRGYTQSLIRKRLEVIGITFHSPGICVLEMEFAKGLYHSLSFDQCEYILAKTRELLGEWCEEKYPFVSASQSLDRLAFVLNVDGENYRQLAVRNKELIEYLQERLHIRINLAFSGMLADWRDISLLHRSAVKALQYAFIYHYGNVFSMEMIEQFESSRLEVPPKEYNIFESLILNDKRDEALEWVEAYRKQIYAGDYSYDSVNNFVMLVHNIAIQIATGRNIFQNEKLKAEIRQQLEEIANLEEAFLCICSLLKLIFASFSQAEEKNSARVISEIKDYIDLNFENDLTVVSIAEAFHMSTGHLNRLFKQTAGENISTFIINSKLHHAAELLVARPELSVKEVSNQMGYFTATYFSKLFKEKFGIAPAEYRKLHSRSTFLS